MTRDEMVDKIQNFNFPVWCAYVSIEFENVADAVMFADICRGIGLKVNTYRTNKWHEVRFSHYGHSFLDYKTSYNESSNHSTVFRSW